MASHPANQEGQFLGDMSPQGLRMDNGSSPFHASDSVNPQGTSGGQGSFGIPHLVALRWSPFTPTTSRKPRLNPPPVIVGKGRADVFNRSFLFSFSFWALFLILFYGIFFFFFFLETCHYCHVDPGQQHGIYPCRNLGYNVRNHQQVLVFMGEILRNGVE